MSSDPYSFESAGAATSGAAGLVVTERSYAPSPAVDRHAFCQVVLPWRGRLEMQIAGERGYAGETWYAFVAADIEHRYWAHGPNRFLVLDLSAELIAEAQRGLATAAAVPESAFQPVGERLSALGQMLRVELARDGLREPLIAASLGLYAGSVLLQPVVSPDAANMPAAGARHLASRTRDFLEASYLEPLTLPQIAAAVGASASHTQRAFRAHQGTTIVGYLQARRLERARELLRATDLSITEVAFAAGFSDHSYFTRLFRRETGMSPSQYRDTLRAGSAKRSR
jgi:AraC-like DNA-binding protein